MIQDVPRPPKPRTCPICNRAAAREGSRFCSDRCQTIDLGRWLKGDYAVPVKAEPNPDEED
ncbi:DNA gyrase inhibitor YacG [Falsiroseomonas stagni]|uniref:DNA gyrase inhibitor YacG n=1 Tax=Falsiroseomonas stagni DSM 19981 TaxID=1123062 RepID=A0A1I3YG37_9PROT|nr:DNA gyrase inhibitor YacG [Falsiroseomonas stagni]SFK30241.1 hypothetical protein SAMN02745775_1011227 [Falsiroseomonas stagni DSM 19981]